MQASNYLINLFFFNNKILLFYKLNAMNFNAIYTHLLWIKKLIQ